MLWQRIRRAIAHGAIMAVITVVLFVVLEGAASVGYSLYVLFVRSTYFMIEEQVHAEYDAELGWVNRKNASLPDLYGRGVGFTSNAQRFRAPRDYPPDPPSGVTRVVCSGDSFTMGHSVADGNEWCAQLGRDVPGIETVNMGMSAYGIDQAYLWYRRDGTSLRHQVHLLAFITPDFDRMAYETFGGYPKPYLQVVGGQLTVKNVPVPRTFDAVPRLRRQREAIMNLSLVRHGRALLERLGMAPAALPGRVLDDDAVRAAAAKIFEDLRDIHRARQSRLVLVYLPRTGDGNDPASDPWRAFVGSEAARLGIEYVDLVEPFRELPIDEGERLFVMPYKPSHYNVRGNAWVVRQLRARIFDQAASRAGAPAPLARR